MTLKGEYLFVYGTLRSDSGHEALPVLARHASLAGAATVRGSLYGFGDYSALVPDENGSVVIGELFALDSLSIQETLDALDDYEGIGPRHPGPHDYRRERVHATLRDGCTVHAWAYVLNRSIEELLRIESGDFVEWRRSRVTSSLGA